MLQTDRQTGRQTDNGPTAYGEPTNRAYVLYSPILETLHTN